MCMVRGVEGQCWWGELIVVIVRDVSDGCVCQGRCGGGVMFCFVLLLSGDGDGWW